MAVWDKRKEENASRAREGQDRVEGASEQLGFDASKPRKHLLGSAGAVDRANKRIERGQRKVSAGADKARDRRAKQEQSLAKEFWHFNANEGINYIESSLERQSLKDDLARKQKKAPQSYETTMDQANRLYSKHMLLSALMPMMAQDEFDMQSFKRVLSAGMVCYMMDPNFRESVRGAIPKLEMPHPLKKAGKAVKGAAGKVMDFASEHTDDESVKAARAKSKGFDRLCSYVDKHRESKDLAWMRARNAYRGSGERLPLNQHSAGMLYVGISKSAYEEMRVPGADRDAIMSDYQTHVQKLQALARNDGMSDSEFNQGCRRVYSNLCRQDPSMATLFQETADNSLEPAPAGTMYRRSPQDPEEQAEFSSSVTGEAYTGRFTLRQPMSFEDCERATDRYMAAGFSQVTSYERFRHITVNPIEKSLYSDSDRAAAKWLSPWKTQGDTLMSCLYDDFMVGPDRDKVTEVWTAAFERHADALVAKHPEYDAQAKEDKTWRYFEVTKEQEDKLFADADEDEDDEGYEYLMYGPMPESEEEAWAQWEAEQAAKREAVKPSEPKADALKASEQGETDSMDWRRKALEQLPDDDEDKGAQDEREK